MTDADHVDYTIEYYAMGQLTKFVPNGSHRIDFTDTSDIVNVAFKAPTGFPGLIAYNDAATLCRSTPR